MFTCKVCAFVFFFIFSFFHDLYIFFWVLNLLFYLKLVIWNFTICQYKSFLGTKQVFKTFLSAASSSILLSSFIKTHLNNPQKFITPVILHLTQNNGARSLFWVFWKLCLLIRKIVAHCTEGKNLIKSCQHLQHIRWTTEKWQLKELSKSLFPDSSHEPKKVRIPGGVQASVLLNLSQVILMSGQG